MLFQNRIVQHQDDKIIDHKHMKNIIWEVEQLPGAAADLLSTLKTWNTAEAESKHSTHTFLTSGFNMFGQSDVSGEVCSRGVGG